jgi:hypothetical protein
MTYYGDFLVDLPIKVVLPCHWYGAYDWWTLETMKILGIIMTHVLMQPPWDLL